MSTWMALIAAVMAGWMVQMWVTYQQAAAFSTQVRKLRSKGMVSVGGAGRRYRGGRAFVALAVDPLTDTVAGAVALQGWTTFARAKDAPALSGLPVDLLRGDEDIPGLSRQQRDAARQAATFVRDARAESPAEQREEVSPHPTQ